jgi:hypothetical protein
MSTVKAQKEPDRKYGPVRILVVKDSPSCRLTVTTGNGATEGLEWVEVIEGTQAELEQCHPETWDLMITHVHQAESGDSSAATESAQSKPFAEAKQTRADIEAAAPAEVGSRSGGIFRKLFRRKKLSAFELEERRATSSAFLAEIQREIGIALSAIEMGDFETLGEIAARLKHDGANYNFEKISGLGAALYDTVPTRDIRTARNIAQKLMAHMEKAIGHYAA